MKLILSPCCLLLPAHTHSHFGHKTREIYMYIYVCEGACLCVVCVRFFLYKSPTHLQQYLSIERRRSINNDKSKKNVCMYTKETLFRWISHKICSPFPFNTSAEVCDCVCVCMCVCACLHFCVHMCVWGCIVCVLLLFGDCSRFSTPSSVA